MIYSHLVDALSGVNKRAKISGIKEDINDTLALLKRAEVIDFGTLPLTAVPAEERQAFLKANPLIKPDAIAYEVPKLTPEEEEFWNEGLIPMPAPICWFEFMLDVRWGILSVLTPDGELRCSAISYRHEEVIVTGVWGAIKKGSTLQESGSFGCSLEFRDHSLYGKRIIAKELSDDFLRNTFIAPVGVVKYLCLMINSSTTEVRSVQPEPKLNKARVKRGAYPFPTHRVVNIVPDRFRSVRSLPDGTRTHASPRLHWRRSHLRTYKQDDGAVRRVVIARMLVGRRELGEVSHEYRFHPTKK